MGLSFLAPLFFGGLALLAAPYIIHQIRRPEREPIRFSSVMFIPNISKEVIERRRIQHILLMLLRMLLFLLLALAFARPYWKTAAAVTETGGPALHAILIDTSYSMGRGELFADAKEMASEIVAKTSDRDRVAVMTFARGQKVLAPFGSSEDTEAGGAVAAKEAIGRASLTEEGTDYLPALQEAQNLLTAQTVPPGQLEPRRILHVISDFQKSGMPASQAGWKLASSIELDLAPVTPEPGRNLSLMDIGIKESTDGALRVLGKVKNWSGDTVTDAQVALIVGGVETGVNPLSLNPGNATQTSFVLNRNGDGPLEGYLELRGDTFALDNRRYFTWNPPRRKPLLVLADERGDQPYPARTFLSRALPDSAGLPWIPQMGALPDLIAALDDPATRPGIVVVGDIDALDPGAGQRMMDYVEKGGQLLVVMSDRMNADVINAAFLERAGLRTDGPAYPDIDPSRAETLSWVDLDHPVFVPFRGANYNDFSTIRFTNHWVFKVEDPAVRVVARFDDEAPAILERTIGSGRLVVWAFALSLDWTNLPKHPRFVPLLHETLAYLGDSTKAASAWEVGRRLTVDALAVNAAGDSTVQVPGQDTPAGARLADFEHDDVSYLAHAGFFRTRAPEDETWRHVDPVNLEAIESDPISIAPEEFMLKMAAAPRIAQPEDAPSPGETVEPAAENTIGAEYGRLIIAFGFALLLLESWYMSSLRG